MMNFQIASDLHIEYNNDKDLDPLTFITPSADVLILAGDIGSYYKLDQLGTFLEKICIHFKSVLYVAGNCEYYRIHEVNPKTMDELFNDFFERVKHIENLHILNRSSIRIGDICIAGCTLWSDVKIRIPDFIVRIEDMTTELYKQKYEKDLSYINKMRVYCKKNNLKLVIVTHHCPTYSIIYDKAPVKRQKDRFVSLYASDLDYLLTKEYIHTWISGHIHINFDLVTAKGTHIVGNQSGKPKDNITDYNREFVVTV
jgi:Icc-related predicted phosphoesterase